MKDSLCLSCLAAAVLTAMVSCSMSSPFSVGEPDSLFSEFTLAWDLVDANYSSFITRPGLDWDAVFAARRDRARSLRNRDELLDLVVEMLAEIGDGQVLLESFSGVVRPFLSGRFENYDRGVWQEYMDRWGFQYQPGEGFGWAYADPDTSIGYIYLSQVHPFMHWADFLSMTAQLMDCSGLILDLRSCGGISDYCNTLFISGRFVHQGGAVVFHRRFRTGPGRCDMGEPKPVYATRNGSWQFSVPIAVLTGRGTDGAGEIMALIAATQPNVVLMGDTTFGAPDIGMPFLLNQSEFTRMWIPGVVIYDPDMNPVSGAGIPPDIPVPCSPADFQAGVDPVLEAAVEYLSAI